MRRKPNLHKRMYAVSLERVGIIAGTMAYSRRMAIECFLNMEPPSEWEKYKHAGYRTVMARVEIIRRNGDVGGSGNG
jgi:hypothetical protein